LDGDQVELLEEIAGIREGISSLSVSLEGINETILGEIDAGLGDLSEDLGSSENNLTARILEMRTRMTLFRNDTKVELANVSALMAKMDELQALSATAERIEGDLDKLNSLQTGVGDIRKEQDEARSGLSTNTILLIASIILQFALIAIGAMILLRKNRPEMHEFE
jgi:hypothetical protein